MKEWGSSIQTASFENFSPHTPNPEIVVGQKVTFLLRILLEFWCCTLGWQPWWMQYFYQESVFLLMVSESNICSPQPRNHGWKKSRSFPSVVSRCLFPRGDRMPAKSKCSWDYLLWGDQCKNLKCSLNALWVVRKTSVCQYLQSVFQWYHVIRAFEDVFDYCCFIVLMQNTTLICLIWCLESLSMARSISMIPFSSLMVPEFLIEI